MKIFEKLLKHTYINFLVIVIIPILFGAFIVCYPLYGRFIKHKLPRELSQNLWGNGQYFLLAIFLLVWGLWVYIFFKCLHIWLHNNFKGITPPTTYKLARIFKNYYELSIHSFYKFLEDSSSYILIFYEKVMQPFVVILMFYICTQKRMLLFAIILRIIPLTIILITTFLDIVILHKFYYLYKIIFILVLPLFERYLVFWCDLFTQNNLEDLDVVTNLYYIEDNPSESTLAFFFRLRDVEYQRSLEDSDYIIKTGFPLVVENLFHIVLEPTWDKTQQLANPNYDTKITLETISRNISLFIFPITMFSQFYQSFRHDIFQKFMFFQSFCYVCIWSYGLYYMF